MRSIALLLLLSGLAIAVLSGPAHADAPAGRIYWTNVSGSPEIRAADLSNPTVQESVAPAEDTPMRVALDLPRSRIYWSDSSGHKIQRASLGGFGAEDIVVTTGLDYPKGLAIDSVGGKMYWSQRESCLFFPPCTLKRANLDGTGVETIAATYADDIEIDYANGRLYVIGRNTFGISRMNFDGSDFEQLVSNVDTSHGLALDIDGGKMYWTQQFLPSRILRANLDGSNVEVLPVAPGYPEDIEIDTAAQKMYWSDFNSDYIGVANLDGSDAQHAVSNVGQPAGLELGPAGAVGGIAELALPGPRDRGMSIAGLAAAAALAATAAALIALRRRVA